MEETTKASMALYTGAILAFMVLLGSTLGVEPAHSQLTALGMWAVLLLASVACVHINNRSILTSRTGEFLWLALWSACFCACAELLNLRLGLWHYAVEPATRSTRWAGWLLEWAALLPCLFTLGEMLGGLRLFRVVKTPAFAAPRLPACFLAAGGAALLLALAWPGHFRSLAAAAFFLLAEPLNLRLALPSLVREWRGGMPLKTLDLMAAGLGLGLLRQLLNSLSGANWEYAAELGGGKGLGLSGLYCAAFPLLALAAYSLYALASFMRGGKSWEPWTRPGKTHIWLPPAALLLIFLSLWTALRAVDAHNVTTFIGWV